MALLAEEVVEEWLNRDGFLTIRGIRLGVQEIDILAVKPDKDNNTCICRHIEVQVSINPISYIANLSKDLQRELNLSPNSAKRRHRKVLCTSVEDFLQKKFYLPKKDSLRKRIYDGDWSFELVINKVHSQEEVEVIREKGITVHNLTDIISDLRNRKTVISAAAGNDLTNLIILGEKLIQRQA